MYNILEQNSKLFYDTYNVVMDLRFSNYSYPLCSPHIVWQCIQTSVRVPVYEIKLPLTYKQMTGD